MKFIIESDELKTAISKCAALIQKCYTTIMSECIHIKANTDNLVFSVNNLSEVAKVKAMANVIETGETLVDYTSLKRILNISGTLTITADDKYVTASNGKKKGKLNIIHDIDSIVHPDTYTIEIGTEDFVTTIQSAEFLRVLNHLKNFVNQRKTAPNTEKGILLDTVNKYMVSMDGYKMLTYTIKALDISKATMVIIPQCIVDSLKKIISKDSVTLNIYADKYYVYVISENFSYRVHAIDGEYCDYQRVIPKTTAVTFDIKVDTDELLTVLKEYKDLTTEKHNRNPMYVLFDHTQMWTAIFNTNYHTTDHIESATGKVPESEFLIGLDAECLLESMKVFKKEHSQPIWSFTDKTKAIKIGDENYTVVIMPVRVRDYDTAKQIRKMLND